MAYMGLTFQKMDANSAKIRKNHGLEEGGRVQQFIDSEVLRHSDPMTPKREGILIDSGKQNTVIGSGLIKYSTPYARRVYYHDEYHFNGAPARGAYWFERMKQRYAKEIIQKAKLL